MPISTESNDLTGGGRLLVLGAVLLLITGCVSPRSVLYTEGPTMKAVLQGAQAQGFGSDELQEQDAARDALRLAAHVNPHEAVRHDAFTRDSLNEIQQLFPKLRNPRFALYIAPHLSTSSRAPVPGYTTEFSLYERDEYALPEEIPPNRYPSREDLARQGPPVAQQPFLPGAIVPEERP